jgi:hypothetical protein
MEIDVMKEKGVVQKSIPSAHHGIVEVHTVKA